MDRKDEADEIKYSSHTLGLALAADMLAAYEKIWNGEFFAEIEKMRKAGEEYRKACEEFKAKFGIEPMFIMDKGVKK